VELAAGPEAWHRLRAHWHFLASPWIAPKVCVAPLHREGAEAAELHPLAARQRLGDLVEDRRDDQLNICLA